MIKKNADHLLKGFRSKVDEMKSVQLDINNYYSDFEKLQERGENTDEVTKNISDDLSKLRLIQSALTRKISRRKQMINQLLAAKSDAIKDATQTVEVATLSNEEMDKLVENVKADDEDIYEPNIIEFVDKVGDKDEPVNDKADDGDLPISPVHYNNEVDDTLYTGTKYGLVCYCDTDSDSA